MSYYELTEESTRTKTGEAFRIKALADIPSKDVKKGDLGGFMCVQSTLTGTAWVSGTSIIVNSHLKDDVCIQGDVLIEDSQLFGKCHIKDYAWLLNVTGNGILANGEIAIRDSKIYTEDQTGFGVLVEGGASIVASTLRHTGVEEGLIAVKDYAKLEKAEVKGSHMEFNKHSTLRYVEIKGSNILFENTRMIHGSKFEGTDMEFNRVYDISKSVIKGENLLVKNRIKIWNSEVDVKDGEICGVNIEINDSTVVGKNIYIQDSVNMQYVDIHGDSVLLSGYASLVGKPDENLLLHGNMQIREFVRDSIRRERKIN